jgi:hypothetical protein
VSGRELVTRTTLRRALVANALTKPVAIAVPAVVLVAWLLIGSWWLLPAALLVYLALAATTFFDADEAERVGRRVYARARAPRPLPRGLDRDITALLDRARTEETRIRAAIGASRLPLDEVAAEVDRLMAELGTIARRAQALVEYLAAQQPEELQRRLDELRREPGFGPEAKKARARAADALEAQLDVLASLDSELDRFRSEMEHLIASLAIVHGQLVRISVADDAHVQAAVAGQVRDLRERVGAVAEAMGEAVERADDDA